MDDRAARGGGSSRSAERDRWDRLHRFERAEAAAALAALTPAESYAQFLAAYRLFGAAAPEDLKPLAEADFRDRVALVAKRQRAFAALAAATAERTAAR